MDEGPSVPIRVVGRYALYRELAAGGMATVHLGRLMGPAGFSRTVAIKRLHEHFARDPDFVSMFLDEARLCARIRHPNVVPTLDVIAEDRQLLLVMEYVQGESLSRLRRAAHAKNEEVPLKVAIAILAGALRGLHAAHEAKDERGTPLGIVHRDVSPQNVVVGADGIARVLDFGIAKASGRLHTTQDRRVKGKLAYMAPEQLRSEAVDRKSDIFAAAVVAWELITGKRLFEAESDGAVVTKVLFDPIPLPSSVMAPSARAGVTALDAIVMRGLERDASKRFSTAREMADALEAAVQPATAAQVGTWVESVASSALDARMAMVQEIESSSSHSREQLNAVVTELTSEPDVTKVGDGPSDTPTLIEPAPSSPSSPSSIISSPELASRAQIAVSSSHLIHPPRDPWPRRATIALAFVTVAVCVLVMRLGRVQPTQHDVASQSASERPMSDPVASAAQAVPPPVQSASSVVDAGDSAQTAPVASSSAHAAPVPSSSPAAHGPTKPKVDCQDPYTRDSLGRKIYKLECL